MITACIRRMACVLALAVHAASFAAPVVVYDTFGPGNTFIDGFGWFAGSGVPGDGSSWVAAQRFSPSGSGVLETVTLPLYAIANEAHHAPRGDVLVTIRQDANGLPGAVLDSAFVTLDITDPSVPVASSLFQLAFGSGASVQSGVDYWLTIGVVEPGPEYFVVWSARDYENTSLHSFSGAPFQNPGVWWPAYLGPAGAARLVVQSAVPEPNNIGLLALSVLLVLRAFRDRRLA